MVSHTQKEHHNPDQGLERSTKRNAVMDGDYKISSRDRLRAHKILDKLIDLHNTFDTWSPLRFSKNILIQVGAQFKVSLYKNSTRQRRYYLDGVLSRTRQDAHLHLQEFGPPEFKRLKDSSELAATIREMSEHEELHESKVDLHNNPLFILRELRSRIRGFSELVNNTNFHEYPGDDSFSHNSSSTWDPYREYARDKAEEDAEDYLYDDDDEEQLSSVTKHIINTATKAKIAASTKATAVLAAQMKARRDVSPGVRYEVLTRDSYKCVLCGKSPANSRHTKLRVDHIIPVAKGGTGESKNLRTLCRDCNAGKSAKLPPIEHVSHSKKLKRQLLKLQKTAKRGK